MAQHVILEAYTFTPAARQVVVTGKAIRREQLVSIVNTTTGTILYNNSDRGRMLSGYTISIDPTYGTETTTITFVYNTAGMSATDKLAILVEETYQEIIPAEVMRDPVEKLRVSNPQSLIDTDFEYGQQPTKWESISLLNNRPSAFIDVTQAISNTARSDLTFYGAGVSNTYVLSGVSASGNVVTVSISNTAGITNGTPIFIQGTLDPAGADGWWVVDSVTGNTSFTYTTTTAPNTGLFDPTKTYAYIGTFYSGAAIPTGANTTAISVNSTAISVTTSGIHGLQPGDHVFLVGTSGATPNTINHAWAVANTPNSTTFNILQRDIQVQ